MTIVATTLPGVFRITSEKRGDARGYLVRTHCEDTFHTAGLNTHWRQSSLTYSPAPATLRGMHFQTAPFGEVKLIRCVSGALWDCLVDIRPNSATFGRWESFDLSEENSMALYVPEGIAHGFFTLTPDVRLLYSMSACHSAPHSCGLLWNDPQVGIQWPGSPDVISEKDATWPGLSSL